MAPDAPQPAPRLEVVNGETEAAGASLAAHRLEGRPSRKAVWLLALLLVLAAAALVFQTRQVGQLGTQVQALESDLSAAREELSAYQGQMGRVRVLMDDLGARVEELRELVASDPTEPRPHPFEAP